MKKKLVALFVCILGVASFAQVKQLKTQTMAMDKDTIQGWSHSGNVSLLLNQSSFSSNWYSGAANNVGGNANVNLGINYKKKGFTWENRILLAYGLTKNENELVKKTQDKIELNSIVGQKAFKNWKYSFFLNFRTQFTDGWNANDKNHDYAVSGFMKPAFLTFGPGLLWSKNDNFKINLAPLTSKVNMVLGDVWFYDSKAKKYYSSKTHEVFGVKPGEKTLCQLGFYASAYYKVGLMKNITLENILNLYSDYLNHPERVDVSYLMNLNMKINKYISANFSAQLLYDYDISKKVQFSEIAGIGLAFNF